MLGHGDIRGGRAVIAAQGAAERLHIHVQHWLSVRVCVFLRGSSVLVCGCSLQLLMLFPAGWRLGLSGRGWDWGEEEEA